MTIKVVNMKTGGRGIYIGRPSPLGNPFFMRDEADREEVVAKYHAWLMEKIKDQDPKVCGELQRIYDLAKKQDINLVCFCAPRLCHGDVIKEELDGALEMEEMRKRNNDKT